MMFENLKVGDLIMIENWAMHHRDLEPRRVEKWPVMAAAMGTAMETLKRKWPTKNSFTKTEYNLKYCAVDWSLIPNNKLVAIVTHVTKEEHSDHDLVHLFCQDGTTRYIRRMVLEGCNNE
jgi:hypothetical protein